MGKKAVRQQKKKARDGNAGLDKNQRLSRQTRQPNPPRRSVKSGRHGHR